MNYLLIIPFVIYLILHVLKAKWQALLVGILLYASIIISTVKNSESGTFVEIGGLIIMSFIIFIVFHTLLDVLCGG